MSDNHDYVAHTPGPWAYDEESQEVYSTHENHGAGWIAFVRGNDSNNTPLPEPQRLANACLIAAAPKLLEALKNMLACMEARDMDSMANAANDACKVVAKAEGRNYE